MTDPEEIREARAEANHQLDRAKERTETASEIADWWKTQRERNNFRKMIQNLARGT